MREELLDAPRQREAMFLPPQLARGGLAPSLEECVARPPREWRMPAATDQLIMEFPAMAVMLFTFVLCFSSTSVVIEIMVGLFCLHYINRTIIFPFRLHTRGKKMPWVIVISGIFFNGVNTFSLGYYFCHLDRKSVV